MAGFVSRRARWILAATAVFSGGLVRARWDGRLAAEERREPVPGSELGERPGLRPAAERVGRGARSRNRRARRRRRDVHGVRARIAADPEVARTRSSGRFVFGFFYHGLEAARSRRRRGSGASSPATAGVVLGGGPIANQEINATVRGDLERAELIALPIVLLAVVVRLPRARRRSAAAARRRRSPSGRRCSGCGRSWR